MAAVSQGTAKLCRIHPVPVPGAPDAPNPYFEQFQGAVAPTPCPSPCTSPLGSSELKDLEEHDTEPETEDSTQSKEEKLRALYGEVIRPRTIRKAIKKVKIQKEKQDCGEPASKKEKKERKPPSGVSWASCVSEVSKTMGIRPPIKKNTPEYDAIRKLFDEKKAACKPLPEETNEQTQDPVA